MSFLLQEKTFFFFQKYIAKEWVAFTKNQHILNTKRRQGGNSW